MGDREEKDRDLYSVLGLNKECTASELKHAYKKLALRWHPDRCSASGNSKFVDEAKTKFQAIQGAYSVLSDENKRFLYDVGAYESDDDEENGMGDFLGEMAVMMSQTKPSENASVCFEDLQTLFDTMFGKDIEAFCSTASQSSSSSTFNDNCSNKRNCSEMSSSSHNSNNITNKNMEFHMESSAFQSTFCMGVSYICLDEYTYARAFCICMPKAAQRIPKPEEVVVVVVVAAVGERHVGNKDSTLLGFLFEHTPNLQVTLSCVYFHCECYRRRWRRRQLRLRI